MTVPLVRCDAAWPDGFDAFVERAEGSAFALRPEFRRALASHGPAWPPRVITVREPGEPGEQRGHGALLAVLGGYLERRFGGAWFRAMPYGTPAGPLFAPGLAETKKAELAGALWDGLDAAARIEGWLGGDVTLSLEAGDGSSPPRAVSPDRAPGRWRTDEAHIIDVAAGPDAWQDSLRKRARQQLTKAVRLGVTVRRGDAERDLASVHALHVEQAQAWGLRSVIPLAFYKSLLEPPTHAALWVAEVSGAVVCGVLAFVEAKEAYVWWSGSSAVARETLAFPYLLSRVVYESGSRTVSLGFSGGRSRLTDFKEQMGAAARPRHILELSPRPKTPYHALLVFARERLRARS